MSGMTPYAPVDWDQPRRSLVRRFFPSVAVVAGLILIAFYGLGPNAACACTPTQPPGPASPVVGVVISVDSAGLGQVDSFVLRLPDASTLTLAVGLLENATEFSPAHLAEHMASSQPIRAFFRLDGDGVPTVYRLEDASG